MLKKEQLLREKHNFKPLSKILHLISLISITIASFKIKTYDLYPIYAEVTEDSSLKITMNYEDLEYLNKNTKIKYQNKYYDIQNISYEDIYIEGNIPYETINITVKLNLDGEKLVKVNLANNYKRIITKITKNIIGGK